MRPALRTSTGHRAGVPFRNPRVQVLDPTPTGVAPLDLVLAHLVRDPGQKLEGLLYTRRLDLG